MIVSSFIIIGSIALLIASIGILTMPGLLCKIHAAAKATTVGVTFMAIGYFITNPTLDTALICTAIVLFLFFTVPIACHVISSRYIGSKPNKKIGFPDITK